MANSSSSSTTGCSGTTIFLVFLVLKLTDVIDWSWWWVTCPLWIGYAIVFGILFLTGGLSGIFLILSGIFGYKKNRRRTFKRK